MSENATTSSTNAVENNKLDPILVKLAENSTPGRTLLRSWLSKSFRVVITDGRILIGLFNCTDKDANIVLAMCAEYLEEGGEARILGNVMIPGKHIVSIEVDTMGQSTNPTDESKDINARQTSVANQPVR